ncbi:hypothetical protein FRC11_000748, partial [Ceratobasidium sp. 423]
MIARDVGANTSLLIDDWGGFDKPWSASFCSFHLNPLLSNRQPRRCIAQSPAGTNSSWVASHPTDPSLVAATDEVKSANVHPFRLSKDDKLRLLDSVETDGEDPAHLAVLEDEIVVGN